MDKTTKPTGEHEEEQGGDKRDGSSPVPPQIKEAVREPKRENENSPRPGEKPKG